MAKYYFLGTLLPELSLDEAPEIGFGELDQLLKENLSDQDFEKTRTIRNLYDISNLRAYWKGELLDKNGNLTFSELEEALLTRSTMPRFVFDFIDKYQTIEERLRHYPELLSLFFRKAIEGNSGFLKSYLSLERELRLVLVAFRANKLGRDIYSELQYEDPEEEIIAQILAQKDAPIYEPPEKYGEIKSLFEMHNDNPIELQKALLKYRFEKIDAWLENDLFALDRVLGYMIKLIMVEKWQQMDKQKGLKIVDSILKETP